MNHPNSGTKQKVKSMYEEQSNEEVSFQSTNSNEWDFNDDDFVNNSQSEWDFIDDYLEVVNEGTDKIAAWSFNDTTTQKAEAPKVAVKTFFPVEEERYIREYNEYDIEEDDDFEDDYALHNSGHEEEPEPAPKQEKYVSSQELMSIFEKLKEKEQEEKRQLEFERQMERKYFDLYGEPPLRNELKAFILSQESAQVNQNNNEEEVVEMESAQEVTKMTMATEVTEVNPVAVAEVRNNNNNNNNDNEVDKMRTQNEAEVTASFQVQVYSPEKKKSTSIAKKDAQEQNIYSNEHFSVLGVSADKEDGYIFKNKLGQIVTKTSRELTSGAGLVGLAPLWWWTKNFSGIDGKSSYHVIGSMLIEKAMDLGIQQANRFRGTGMYFEKDGSLLYHQGNTLYHNGKANSIVEFKSTNIYTTNVEHDNIHEFSALTKAELEAFNEIYVKPAFKTELERILFLGWIPTALMCGVMPWRSHIWITASKGTGKSTLINNFIDPLIGNIALSTVSPTEAYIRQSTGNSSIPVIIDEAEAAAKHTAQIITTAVNASTGKAASTGRGSAAGSAVSFSCKSSFMFASVTVPTLKDTEAGRISVLEVVRDRSKDFSQQDYRTLETLAPRWRKYIVDSGERLLRTIDMFNRLLKVYLKDDRAADQYATLFGGYWIAFHTEELSEEAAKAFIVESGVKETFAKDETMSSSDEVVLEILSVELSVMLPTGVKDKMSVAQAIHAIHTQNNTNDIHKELELLGMRILKSGELFITANNRKLASCLSTRYSKGYSTSLARHEAVLKSNNKQRVAGTLVSGYVFDIVKLGVLIGD